MKDKKGQMGIIFFFLLLFTILIVGFIASMVVGIIDFGSDTVTPIMENLGVAGDANLSHASKVTFGTANTFVQAMPWLIGFAYLAALGFSFAFAIGYRVNPNPIFIGLYFMLIILLIFGTILMSNVYESIYEGNNELATRLQEQTILSFMILYSPAIMVLIAFITGIFIFAGPQDPFGGGI